MASTIQSISTAVPQWGMENNGVLGSETAGFDFFNYLLGLQRHPNQSSSLDLLTGSPSATSQAAPEDSKTDSLVGLFTKQSGKDKEAWAALATASSVASTQVGTMGNNSALANAAFTQGNNPNGNSLDREALSLKDSIGASLSTRYAQGIATSKQDTSAANSLQGIANEVSQAVGGRSADDMGNKSSIVWERSSSNLPKEALKSYGTMARLSMTPAEEVNARFAEQSSIHEAQGFNELANSKATASTSDRLSLSNGELMGNVHELKSGHKQKSEAMSGLFGISASKVAGPIQGIETTTTGTNSVSMGPEVVELSQVFGKVDALVNRGGGKMVINLNPPELGQVEIEVKTEGNRVEIALNSASENTKSVLEAGLPDLVQSIQGQDLIVSKLEVNLSDSLGFSQDLGQQTFSSYQNSSSAYGEGARSQGGLNQSKESLTGARSNSPSNTGMASASGAVSARGSYNSRGLDLKI